MKFMKANIGHIILLTAIIAIIGISAYKLIAWDNSKNPENPDDDDYVFTAIETEDYTAVVNPKYLEGREDDGVTTIVMLGDETISRVSDETGIVSQLANGLDAVVYDCSFPNTYASSRYYYYEAADPVDVFSLYWVANAIGGKSYANLENVVDNVPNNQEKYQESLDTLSSIDFETVDVITILYGQGDYLNGRQITDVLEANAQFTYTGAYKSAIEAIQFSYPHIRILLVSPNFCMLNDNDGNLVASNVTNTTFGTLTNYMVAAKNIAVMKSVSFLDNCYGLPITVDNYKEYLEDGRYPNETTRTMIADRIIDMLE